MLAAWRSCCVVNWVKVGRCVPPFGRNNLTELKYRKWSVTLWVCFNRQVDRNQLELRWTALRGYSAGPTAPTRFAILLVHLCIDWFIQRRPVHWQLGAGCFLEKAGGKYFFFLVANCKDYTCAVRRRDLPQCCLNCTKFDKLILRKITKIVASRCDILKPKCIKFDFGWGSVPDPAGVLQRSPDPYSWI